MSLSSSVVTINLVLFPAPIQCIITIIVTVLLSSIYCFLRPFRHLDDIGIGRRLLVGYENFLAVEVFGAFKRWHVDLYRRYVAHRKMIRYMEIWVICSIHCVRSPHQTNDENIKTWKHYRDTYVDEIPARMSAPYKVAFARRNWACSMDIMDRDSWTSHAANGRTTARSGESKFITIALLSGWFPKYEIVEGACDSHSS